MRIEIEEQNEDYIKAIIYSPFKPEIVWKSIEWYRRYSLGDGKEFILKKVSIITFKDYISKK